MIGTLTKLRRSKAGFTLVELIVVIAILGILAGIAVPVYSGYIEKAGEAGDLQLLGAVNTAFAAACAEMGVDPTGIDAAVIWTDNRVTGMSPTSLNDDFLFYYGSNTNRSFKTFSSIGYDKSTGLFIGNGGTIYMNYERADGTIVTLAINADDVEAFKASTFGGENITAAELMEEVQKVANQAAGTLSSNPNLLKSTIRNLEIEMGGAEVYMNTAGDQLTPTEYNARIAALKKEFKRNHPQDEFANATEWNKAAAQYANEQMADYSLTIVNGGYTAYLKTLGMTDEDIAAMTTQQKANSLVVIAAQGAKNLSADAVLASIDTSTGTIQLLPGQGELATVTKTTIPYALAMAYANSDYANNQTVGSRAAVNETISGGSSSDVRTLWDNKDNPQALAFYVSLLFPQYTGITPTLTKNGSTYSASFVAEADPGMNAKAYFDEKSGQMASIADLNTMVGEIMRSDGFQTYFQSEQAKTDTNGFLAAMNMINDNAAGVGWEELLNQGYNSNTLKGIVSTLVGETYTP